MKVNFTSAGISVRLRFITAMLFAVVLFFYIILDGEPLHPIIPVMVFVTSMYGCISISGYILFDRAYLVAALAAILLISFYAKGHFNALLSGSIALFIVPALLMFAGRKINWYGNYLQTNLETNVSTT